MDYTRRTAMSVDAHYAGCELAQMSQAEAVALACSLLPDGWVKSAFEGHGCVSLGMFGLEGPDEESTMWPVIFFGIERPENAALGNSRRIAVVRLTYFDGEFSARIGERGTVDWSRYMGDREGQPSHVNGDKPAETPAEGVAAWSTAPLG